MADIPLKSFTFPGLPDKYTTPVVDNTLAVAGAAADAKKTGDEISGLKNDLSDGTFTVNNAENAEQLTSTVGIEDTTPYLFRTSGGSNDIGDREDVRKIVGGTIVNNQLFPFESDSWTMADLAFSVTNGKLTASGTASSTGIKAIFPSRIYNTLKLIKGHVYFLYFSGDYNFNELRYVIYGTVNQSINLVDKTSKVFKSNVDNCTDSEYVISITSGTTYSATFDTSLVDLTKDYGTSIADYVLSLETATAGAGVAWLKKHFPKQFDSGYQAYDVGSLQSVSGLTMHRMVGFNQWDEETEIGDIDGNTGAFKTGNYLRTKNHIPVLPNTTYYFNIPSAVFFYEYDANKDVIMNGNYAYHSQLTSGTFTTGVNTHFITFRNNIDNASQTYNHDICINFHWDGEKDGTYEPYKTWSYALDDSITLRGIPKVDANGNLYYDGDEYLPDGTVNRRYGIVDLGTLTWHVNNHAELGAYFYADVTSLGIKYGRHQSIIDEVGVCPKYTFSTRTVATFADKTICYDGNNTAITQVCIKDSAYSDGATFKASLSGVYLVYVKQTPTTETASPYQATQIVDDFGTEEYVLADGAFPVPVGHNTMYQNNLRAKLEMAPESPDGDGLYVVQQESGENTYIPLASTATIQDILTRLTALENA